MPHALAAAFATASTCDSAGRHCPPRTAGRCVGAKTTKSSSCVPAPSSGRAASGSGSVTFPPALRKPFALRVPCPATGRLATSSLLTGFRLSACRSRQSRSMTMAKGTEKRLPDSKTQHLPSCHPYLKLGRSVLGTPGQGQGPRQKRGGETQVKGPQGAPRERPAPAAPGAEQVQRCQGLRAVRVPGAVFGHLLGARGEEPRRRGHRR
mmetsp:Transcript_23615/g.70544  ORF Transcript_23615/g.70544 Transcript_23615/m.70544 type:complete len:208 (+) Transcript_23615:98-721(+)